jgi:hypothetical protein
MKSQPANAAPLLPAIERIYPELEALPASWTVSGDRWGDIGLARAAELLGEEGRPFVASLKRIRPDLEARSKTTKQGDTLQQALDRLEEVVKAYEDKFGEVKIE